MIRARLSLFALEGRENPSVPGIDPIGLPGPAPVDPPPAPTTPVVIGIGTGIIDGIVDVTTPPAPPSSSLNPGDPYTPLPQ